MRADETRGEGEGEDPLGWLLGGKADHVVEKLIRPLSRLPMRAAHFPSPKLTLAAIRDRFVEDADAVLAAAAAELTGSRTIFPSEAIIKTAVEKARATHNRPITITPASPQWQAWLAHWRASGQPRQASIAETRGEWFVDRAWPPGAEPRRDVA